MDRYTLVYDFVATRLIRQSTFIRTECKPVSFSLFNSFLSLLIKTPFLYNQRKNSKKPKHDEINNSQENVII